MGRELTAEMSFSTTFSEVEFKLAATAHMKKLTESSDALPLGKLRDIRPTLSQIKIPGTFATTDQVADIRKTLEAMGELRKYFAQSCEDAAIQQSSPLLATVAPLEDFPQIIKEIDRVVDPLGNIRDNASPQLAEIRSQLRSVAGSIASAMRRVMAKAAADGLIDTDVAPSVRDGRLVIPVSPMNKRRIPGIVHDESATGKTVFIEPAEVVEANNRQRSLQIEEHREEIKVLTILADFLRPWIEPIGMSLAITGEIDFIHAKALYAIDVEGEMPALENDCAIEWYHACHPVLLTKLRESGRSIVPLDIHLTPERRILIISGPNAGGKSVCLKTVGIVQYMGQCGVLPTIHSNSHFGVFTDIFVDIGDDQSIENDLSTYSSHLRNMKAFLRGGGPSSLMLIDEFGSGTEPQIGGALAQAILKRFNDMKMWGVITTHYQNLKHFADDTEGLVNGSMLYDRQQMCPLFKLSIGTPGSSFALEIARKTGLPLEIIDDAKEIVGSDYVNIDKYLLDIARDKRYWENKRTSIKLKEKRIDQVLERYETDADDIRQRRREIIAEAKEEAKRIVSGSNAAIERTILAIRESQAEREATLQARNKLKAELAELTDDEIVEHPKLRQEKRPKKKKKNTPAASATPAAPKELAPGDNVKLDGQGTVGTIVSIDKKKATVTFGNLKTTVDLDRLKPTNATVKPVGRTTSIVSDSTYNDQRTRQLNFKQEIDVRGMRADEAVQAVTYFLDDATQFNIGRVRILHGTGTGALRMAIRQYVATVPQVVHFHDEDVRFGGAGITVVELE